MTSPTTESATADDLRRSSRQLLRLYLPAGLLIAALPVGSAIGRTAAFVLAGFTYAGAGIAILIGRSDLRLRLWQLVALAAGAAAAFSVFASAVGPEDGLSPRQLAALAALMLCLGPLGGALLRGYESHWRLAAATRDYRIAVNQVGVQAFLEANCRLVHGPEPDPGHDEDDAMRALWEPVNARVWGSIRLLDVRDGTRQSDGPNAGLFDRLLIAVPASITTCSQAQAWTYGPKLSGYDPARRT